MQPHATQLLNTLPPAVPAPRSHRFASRLPGLRHEEHRAVQRYLFAILAVATCAACPSELSSLVYAGCPPSQTCPRGHTPGEMRRLPRRRTLFD